MPLSPSDVQYLNKLLDQHLKTRQVWTWGRYASLAAGILCLGIGVMFCVQARILGNIPALMFPPMAHHAAPASTRPVTEDQMLKLMESSQEMLKGYAQFSAEMATLQMASYFLAMFQFGFGFVLLMKTASNWNRHRRDTILITLLREKCAVELAGT
ncbi:MAG TPA: hypothetical protein VGN88_02830 [Phycisphaerae bacterium]|jgi:hypothetical protein